MMHEVAAIVQAWTSHKLSDLCYEIGRQTGSDIRLTTQQNDEHHITSTT